MKWGDVFCKKADLSSIRRVHYVQYQYFLFYILLIWGVRTQRTLRACIQLLDGI